MRITKTMTFKEKNMKRTVLLIVVAILSVLMVGCGSTDNEELLLDQQKQNAKTEIENYRQELSPELSEAGQGYNDDLIEIYFGRIDDAEEGVDELKQTCLLKMEQTFISEKKDAKIAEINSEYDPAIDKVCGWLDGLLEYGVYRGTEKEYNAEVKDIDEQLRNIATEKTKKKNYYAQMCAISGYSQSWLQGKYSEVDSEYNASYNYLVAEKNYLEALWQNRSQYDEYLALLGGLEDERDALIAKANQEYEQRNGEIENLIGELK